MIRYAVRRILLAIPLLVGVSALVFFLANAIPGSPIQSNPAQVGGSLKDAERIRQLYGLGRPVWQRYLTWSWHLLHGDLGTSYQRHDEVSHEILIRLPGTLALMISAFVVALAIAVPLGSLAAARAHKSADHVVVTASAIGLSIPSFWLGLILILVFASRLHWFPAGGNGPVFGGTILDQLWYLVLPATTVAVGLCAEWLRYVRGQMLGILSLDYIRTARAKGAGEGRLLIVHALRNAALPLVQLLGLSLPTLFSGALMVEIVFNRSGIGYLTYTAASNRDYPVVMGTVVVASVLVVIGNLLADLASAALDPRIRVA